MDRAPSYAHLAALTDERGIFEHALHDVPRPEHGYCVDDVARALIVTVLEPDQSAALARLSETYLRFLESGLSADGRSHNRMSASGEWEDRAGVGDWWGRAIWALGVTASHAPLEYTRKRAVRAFHRAAETRSPHLRSMAFAALGAIEVALADPSDEQARSLVVDAVGMVPEFHGRSWPWPEARLAYANGAIVEMVIGAGQVLDDPRLVERGIALLDFLLELEIDGDHFSVTGHEGRGEGEIGPQFDQQPIEVAAIVDACARAFSVTGDPRWLGFVHLGYEWFQGKNDSNTVMFDEFTGAGFDGLEPFGRNENRGAESTLAALAVYQQDRRARSPSARSPTNDRPTPHRAVALRLVPHDCPVLSARDTISSTHSRVAEITDRVMRLPETAIDSMAEGIVANFSGRHVQFDTILADNASMVSSRLPVATKLTPQQTVVLGAAFTMEYATEGAALCNPSAIEHPDQAGLRDGELRVAIAVRSIGEGHLSSISFVTAVIGADEAT